jgi:hypothetical protein
VHFSPPGNRYDASGEATSLSGPVGREATVSRSSRRDEKSLSGTTRLLPAQQAIAQVALICFSDEGPFPWREPDDRQFLTENAGTVSPGLLFRGANALLLT